VPTTRVWLDDDPTGTSAFDLIAAAAEENKRKTASRPASGAKKEGWNIDWQDNHRAIAKKRNR